MYIYLASVTMNYDIVDHVGDPDKFIKQRVCFQTFTGIIEIDRLAYYFDVDNNKTIFINLPIVADQLRLEIKNILKQFRKLIKKRHGNVVDYYLAPFSIDGLWCTQEMARLFELIILARPFHIYLDEQD
jgi:hypothetical protein